MKFKPGDIAIHKAEKYPSVASKPFLVQAVGEMVDIDGVKREMIVLDSDTTYPMLKEANLYYTQTEIKVMYELEKNK